MDEPRNPFPREPENPSEELGITRILLTLWEHRNWVAAATFVITLAGLFYAIFAKPIYRSESIIALKENGRESGGSNLFSQLGGMGSVSLGLGMGSTNLNKIEVTLKGRDLAESVIKTNNLMPVLFPNQWDAARGAWKSSDPEKIPTLDEGVEVLRKRILTVGIEFKKGLITIGVNHRDPVLAKRMVDFYLEGLNKKIRQDVVYDAEQNRLFLERQLNQASDPVLAEKINNLIASEIEKMMFASAQSVQILEKPVVPLSRTSPRRGRTVIMAFVMGLFLSGASVFALKGFQKLRTTLARGAVSHSKDRY